ncbi:SDR family oxidoreductase [Chitinilyticum piscinae]|uniref:SDR family oxidoreductase n=1 Tax=Chitinilyticum piscinae TaxID=2866724 RepID=A0A8J7K9M4_9NEIS|nr:SDR family oxidoreductase [Chitinilyticum piscinae]MBE9608389.1 SDR family oxidoreductase [Chitinilyticum piscinae]
MNNTTQPALAGKTALVTGASSGIGLATARALLTAGAARVYITGRDAARLAAAAAELGERAVALRTDSSLPGDLDALRGAIAAAGDRLDVLFVNAGVAHYNQLGATSEAEYARIFDTNVKGVFFTVQALLGVLGDGASIVLNASVASSKGMAGLALYNASKAAVRSFARTWANELKDRQIRVNAISPGVTLTGIQAGGLGLDEAQMAGLEGFVRETVPAGRIAAAAEIAQAVLFLASPAASYVNGSELAVDGGLAQI